MVKPNFFEEADISFEKVSAEINDPVGPVIGQHISGVIRAINVDSKAAIVATVKQLSMPIRINQRWFDFPMGFFDVEGIGRIRINSPLLSVKVLAADVVLISFDTDPRGQYPGAYLALCMEDVPHNTHDSVNVADHVSLFFVEDVINRNINETDNAYAGRVHHFRNMVQRWQYFADRIYVETGISLHKFPLRTILMFGSFFGWLINTGQDEAQNELLDILKNKDQDFLNAFIAGFEICEFNPEDGLLILRLLNRRNSKQSMQILAYYNFLCGQIVVDECLERVANQRERDCLTQQYISSKNAVRRLIIEASSLDDNALFDAFLLDTNRFLEDQIFMGARLSHLLKVASEKHVKPEEIADIDDCGLVEVKILSGGNRVKSSSRVAMQDPDNYLTSDFGVSDYQMIIDNLDIYDKTNPEWKQILIDNIPDDLEDPNTLFVVVRMKDVNLSADVNTVGVIKVRPDPAGSERVFYIGTLYVEEYLHQYNVADYLQEQAERLIEEHFGCDDGYIYWGAVCTRNRAMQRHIEHANGIVTAIMTESDGERTSDNLYRVEFGQKTLFISKGSKRDDLKFLIDQGCDSITFDKRAFVAFRKYDTSLDSKDDYVGEMTDFFNRGYVITRYFYGFSNNSPDFRETYVVFEKQTEPIDSPSSDFDD